MICLEIKCIELLSQHVSKMKSGHYTPMYHKNRRIAARDRLSGKAARAAGAHPDTRTQASSRMIVSRDDGLPTGWMNNPGPGACQHGAARGVSQARSTAAVPATGAAMPADRRKKPMNQAGPV
jgi:hypothetical protein